MLERLVSAWPDLVKRVQDISRARVPGVLRKGKGEVFLGIFFLGTGPGNLKPVARLFFLIGAKQTSFSVIRHDPQS